MDDWAAPTTEQKKKLVEALRARHYAYVNSSLALEAFVSDALETSEKKIQELAELTDKVRLFERVKVASVGPIVERISDDEYNLILDDKQAELMLEAVTGQHERYLSHPQIAREMVFIYAFALFDGLTADLIRILYVQLPATLRSSRKISYEEVLNYSTREELIEVLADREVQEITRLSVSDQMSYFLNKHHVDALAAADVSVTDLQFSSHKRNLLVHNSGVVTPGFAHLSGAAEGVGSKVVLEDTDLKRDLEMLRAVSGELVRGLLDKFKPAESELPLITEDLGR